MHVFRSLEEFPGDKLASIVSVGNFDGVHCAHQAVLGEVAKCARARSGRSLAVTFDPHPARVVRPQIPTKLITPLWAKLKLLEQTGIDAVLVLPFSPDLSRISPKTFSQEILAKRLRATEVHEGDNFHFGHRAEGNVQQLVAFGKAFGFGVKIYPQMKIRGEVVSSSRIRQLLAEGKVAKARHLLGRVFSIRASPGKGRGYGHKYTVPTINLAGYDELVPAHGVYITETRIGSERFNSVTNVGTRPTFGQDLFAVVESHVLNFHEIEFDADTEIEVFFLQYLRPEQKWPSAKALQAQIAKDITKTKHFFALRAAQ